MKTWLLLLVCYAALLLALAVFGVSTQAGELLTNGGFEQGTAGWAANPGDLNVSADAYSGAASGKLSGAGLYTYRVYQWVNVGSGGSYELAGRLKDGGNVQRAFLELTWFDAAGSAIGSQLVSADMMPGASGWQFLSTGSGIAPASATSARAAVVVRPFNSDPFALLMDDLSLQGSTPPPPSPTPTETATPTPGVTPKPTLPPGPPSPPSQPSPSPTNTSTPYPSPSPTSTPFPDPTEPAPTPESEPDYFSALVNSSFEIASNDGRPYGWRKFGGELNRGEELSWEGRFSAVLSSATASSKWVYQTVSVSGGRFYVFSGHAYKNDPKIPAAYLRVSWYASNDGSGSLLDSVDSTESLTANWPGFRYLTTGPVQAPPEARSAKLRLMAVTLSGPGRVFYDSVSFNETTAPEGGEGSGGTSATSGRNRTGGAASRRAESPLAQASQLNRLLNFSGLEGILAGRSGPHSLANVKPAREDKADTSGGSDRSTILLGLTVPGPSLALAFLGYRYWRGRRSLIAPR